MQRVKRVLRLSRPGAYDYILPGIMHKHTGERERRERKIERGREREYEITSVRSGCSAMQRCRVCSTAFVRRNATPAVVPERKYTTLPIKQQLAFLL